MTKFVVPAALAALALCTPVAVQAQTFAYPQAPTVTTRDALDEFGGPSGYFGGPAPLVARPMTVAPPDVMWIQGHYNWNPAIQSYAWIEGQYVQAPHQNAQWVAGHWTQTPTAWIWVGGRWN